MLRMRSDKKMLCDVKGCSNERAIKVYIIYPPVAFCSTCYNRYSLKVESLHKKVSEITKAFMNNDQNESSQDVKSPGCTHPSMNVIIGQVKQG